MFEGRLVDDEPNYVRIHSDELGGTIYIDHGVSAAPSAAVWVALRPEKIMITREPCAGPDNCVPGTVKEIAYHGDNSTYLVQLRGGKMVRVTQPNVVRHAETRITWDEAVHLSWHPTSAVVVTQ